MLEWTRVWSKYHKKVDANLKFLIQATDKGQIITLHKTSVYSNMQVQTYFLYCVGLWTKAHSSPLLNLSLFLIQD